MATASPEIPKQVKKDITPDIPELQAAEAINREEKPDTHESSLYHDDEEKEADAASKVGGIDALSEAESGKNTEEETEEEDDNEGLYTPKDKKSMLQKLNPLKGINGLSSKKWALAGVAVPLSVIVALIILAVLFVGSLKIPTLAEHITAYQFARVTSEYADTADSITNEEVAIQASDDSLYGQLKGQYQNLRDNTWGKLDAYRPGKVIENMEADRNLKFNYEPSGILGRPKLKGVTLDNTTYLVKDVKGPWKYIPGVNKVLKLKNEVGFANEFFPQLNAGMQADSVNPLVRGAIENQFREKAGISLIAYINSKFNGETPSEAELTEAREAYNAIDQEQQASQIPIEQDLRTATQNADTQTANDVKSDSTLQKILNHGGVDPNVVADFQNSLGVSGFKTALEVINPAAKVFTPICLIYDGSLNNAQPSIDEQSTEEARTFYYVSTAADQQKAGQVNGEAVGALNQQAGDITQSNAEIRAGGGNVNTTNSLSAEASPTGEFTIMNALGIDPGVTNTIADNVCPVITNTKVLVGLALANILATVFTGGTSEATEEATGNVADTLLGQVSNQVLNKVVGESAGKYAGEVGDFVQDTAVNAGLIGGATIAARLIVMGDSNNLHNGLQSNTDLTNTADAGGNYVANNLDQTMNYGRPMVQSEVNDSDQQSSAQLATKINSESTYERYADIYNPDSLANHLVISASSYMSLSSITSHMQNLVGSILQPLKSLANMFTGLDKGVAAAGANGNDDATDYGNVQFGWSKSEENLITTDPSYQMLENQARLEESGQEDNISNTYSKCFTDSIGTLLTGSDNGGDPEIVRDENGNVLDKGLCSKTNLGPNNPTYGDLVFRWRVAMRDTNGLNQLGQEQGSSS
jgi:hypothetical protein